MKPAKIIPRRQAVKAIVTAAAAGPFALASSALVVMKTGGVTNFQAAGPELKILAITDLHLFWRTSIHDLRTMRLIKQMTERFQPGLIVVDGDVWNDSLKKFDAKMCESFCEKMGGLGVPWAFVRGNHDYARDFEVCEVMLATAPNSLYPGRGSNANYRVDVHGPDGRVAWRLLVLNDAAPALGFNDAVIARLSDEVAAIKNGPEPDAPTLLFCHVPLRAFEDLVAQGLARGVMNEKVCHEDGSPEALAAVRDAGIIKAVFCGHDHVNNYRGELEGVHLEYVRATGFGGYGNSKLRKGGTLITAAMDGSGKFETVTVFGSGESEELLGTPELVTGP